MKFKKTIFHHLKRGKKYSDYFKTFLRSKDHSGMEKFIV